MMLDYLKKRLSLAITLVLFVFIVMVISVFIVGAISVVLDRAGIISLSWTHGGSQVKNERNPGGPFIAFLGLCILLGTALTAFFGKIALKPIRKVIAATHQVAEGNFDVKVNITGIGELEELSHSFNKMTHELSTIETLRNDFVNNFSHEFKTPIVSIRGFAKLLKEGSLSEEEKHEYLDIIITESERLTELSTNILNLSQYENIEIVTDKNQFRLDEQIRRVIVLMEPKWSAKAIDFDVELDEINLVGNEDLLQQIWINLLDNAVKFSYQSGLISITLANAPDGIRFSIHDDGPGMNAQTKAHMFDKFYQGDTSHSKSGYGLGLTMVKRITELCGGSIEVHSEVGHGSTFIVSLPRES